jgi:hypothetical protein
MLAVGVSPAVQRAAFEAGFPAPTSPSSSAVSPWTALSVLQPLQTAPSAGLGCEAASKTQYNVTSNRQLRLQTLLNNLGKRFGGNDLAVMQVRRLISPEVVVAVWPSSSPPHTFIPFRVYNTATSVGATVLEFSAAFSFLCAIFWVLCRGCGL